MQTLLELKTTAREGYQWTGKRLQYGYFHYGLATVVSVHWVSVFVLSEKYGMFSHAMKRFAIPYTKKGENQCVAEDQTRVPLGLSIAGLRVWALGASSQGPQQGGLSGGEKKQCPTGYTQSDVTGVSGLQNP